MRFCNQQNSKINDKKLNARNFYSKKVIKNTNFKSLNIFSEISLDFTALKGKKSSKFIGEIWGKFLNCKTFDRGINGRNF